MNRQNRSKINYLLMSWPKGTVATYNWLKSQGVYRQLANTYVKGSWLEQLGRGAFKRAGDTVDWTSALYAMQTQLNLSIHAAGKSALQMQGYAHYLPAGTIVSAVLFGNPNEKLPAWFRHYQWKAQIRYVATRLFDDEGGALALTDYKTGDYSIKISSPEKAMLEVCYDVPDEESFEEATHLMEGLTTLRPGVVQTLLEKCNSVKTKRVFMYLAEGQDHLWLKKLNLSKVNFGSGNRSLCEGGHYDQKYKIVVPQKALAA